MKDEYAWDHRNRLVQVTTKNRLGAVTQVVNQQYDYLNCWIGRTVYSDQAETMLLDETYFIQDGNQVALQFSGDAAADLTQRYLWGLSSRQCLPQQPAHRRRALWTFQISHGC